jgi:hypothetical protein
VCVCVCVVTVEDIEIMICEHILQNVAGVGSSKQLVNVCTVDEFQKQRDGWQGWLTASRGSARQKYIGRQTHMGR